MHSDAFDVIPFEVCLLTCLSQRYAHFNYRTSRVIGRNWVLVHSVTFTKVLSVTLLLPCSLFLSAGSYLGIPVAIKEVLPSTDYDVAKYFEREWRLMKYP